MKNNSLFTDFAPAERAAEQDLKKQHQTISSNQTLKKVLDAVPEAVLILNHERQIVYVNDATLKMLGANDFKTICGQRPGELLDCVHSKKSKGGCGTTSFCRYCGAVIAILASQKGQVSEEECRITQADTGDALDLKVKSSPYSEQGIQYYVFSIRDISSEKRKQAIERIFFHDILNTASGLYGYSELLLDNNSSKSDDFKVIIHQLSQEIIDEIHSQRQLIAAENDELDSDPTDVNSLEILNRVVKTYTKHLVAEDKEISIDSDSESIDFLIDETLLFRVLSNILKNALEASDSGKTVFVSCKKNDNSVEFKISNHQVMPKSVQYQIFQRSFSTKGTGRGLGTYGIKLLSEKYLKGKVSFLSDEKEGTTFIVKYPII